MTNIKRFKSKEEIQQQACEWISRIDRGLTSAEHDALQKWIQSNDSHQQTLMNMAATWDDLSALNELKGLISIDNTHKRNVFSHQHSALWAIAASFALIIIALGVNLFNDQHTEIDTPSYIAALVTAVGEQKPVTLEDGSVVYLNTNTKVNVHFSKQIRRITLLQGEALFEVAHDTTRPFIVTAGNKTITAVGTAFNVQLMDDEHFELLVTEGKVRLKNINQGKITDPSNISAIDDQGTLVISGQKAQLNQGNVQATHLDIQQIQNELAWRQGIVVFNGEPLEQALKEISRYTPIEFEFSDVKVKQKRVAGYFKAGDIDGLLAALKNNFSITYKKVNNNTIMLFSDT